MKFRSVELSCYIYALVFVFNIRTTSAITLKFGITNTAQVGQIIDSVELNSALSTPDEDLNVRYTTVQFDANDDYDTCRQIYSDYSTHKLLDENDEIAEVYYDPFSLERVPGHSSEAEQLVPPKKSPAAIVFFREEDCDRGIPVTSSSYPFPGLIVSLYPYTPVLNNYIQDQVAYLHFTIRDRNEGTPWSDPLYILDLRFRALKLLYKSEVEKLQKALVKTRGRIHVLGIFSDYVKKNKNTIRESAWKPSPPPELWPDDEYESGYPPAENLDDPKLRLTKMGEYAKSFGGWRKDKTLYNEFKDFVFPKKKEDSNEPNLLDQAVILDGEEEPLAQLPHELKHSVHNPNKILDDEAQSEASTPDFRARLDEPQTPSFPVDDIPRRLDPNLKVSQDQSNQAAELKQLWLDVKFNLDDELRNIAGNDNKRPPLPPRKKKMMEQPAVADKKLKNNNKLNLVQLPPVEYDPEKDKFSINQNQQIPQIEYSPRNDRFRNDEDKVGINGPELRGDRQKESAMRQKFNGKEQLQGAGLLDGEKSD